MSDGSSSWFRVVLAVVAGFCAWFAVATIGNLAIRAFVPGYEAAEKAMTFSLGMMVTRLVLGIVSSMAAGEVCALVARRARAATYVLAFLLFATFVPIHLGLWDKFPIWYHLVFLGSLIPATLMGAGLFTHRRKNKY